MTTQQNTLGNLTERPTPKIPRDLVDVWEYHSQQAKHFEPFGANNDLTLFHRQCAAVIVEAQRELANRS